MRRECGAVRRTTRHALGLALVLVLAAGGCGKRNLGTVSGVVNYQNKPLPGGYVTFNSVGPDGKIGASKSATIEANGSYTVAGVPAGPAKITVQGPPGQIVSTPQTVGKGMQIPVRAKPAVVVPAHYGNADQTDLKYDVVAGPQTHNIDLK
jgi:hypothetical protein